jgi:hypothetical protein
LSRLRSLRFQVTDLLAELDAHIEDLMQQSVAEYHADPHRLKRGWAVDEAWRQLEAVANAAAMDEEEKLRWAAAIKKDIAATGSIASRRAPAAQALYDAAPQPRFRDEEMVIWIPADHPDVGRPATRPSAPSLRWPWRHKR